MTTIFGSLRNEAKAAGVPDSADAMEAFFLDRVRRNLHVVLCFSPVGDVFRIRARRFPGLINCTAIDWFHAWPREALQSVAMRFLEDVDLSKAETKTSIAHHMAEVHTSVTVMSIKYRAQRRRANYVTPKSFLELISFYKGASLRASAAARPRSRGARAPSDLLTEKRTLVGKLIQRLDTGLSTLRKTARDVAELQVDLKQTMIRVDEKKAATEALLVQMGLQRKEAEDQQAIAEREAQKAAKCARRVAGEGGWGG